MESKGEDQKASAFCTNLFVGLAQMFTITFMLVGWFWSLTWGIYMVILAGTYTNGLLTLRDSESDSDSLWDFKNN